jgi:hypothetical protein
MAARKILLRSAVHVRNELNNKPKVGAAVAAARLTIFLGAAKYVESLR